MFGILKKKLTNFGDKLKHKLESKSPEKEEEKKEIIAETDNEAPAKKETNVKVEAITEKIEEDKKTKTIKNEKEVEAKIKEQEKTDSLKENDFLDEKEKREFEKIQKEIEEEEKTVSKENKKETFQEKGKDKQEKEEQIEVQKKDAEKELVVKEKIISERELFEEDEETENEEAELEIIEERKQKEIANEKKRNIEIKHFDEDKRELKADLRATSKLKSIFSGKVEIKEKDIEELLFELELSLIESDVEQDTAKEIVQKIKQRIVGEKISPKNINDYLKEEIKKILSEMMETKKINVLEDAKKTKPYKILMLGPNGAGKTTSIAKLTNYFQKNGLSVILAAGDTFRAGAIDQLQEHADKLGVKVIKQQYGADPAAVAFDAIKSAEANKIDVIIIDSAGRQETNKNLMEELKKIERVAKPNLKIYVGEAYTGQSLLEMAKEFDDNIGIDGFILTKIDADAKGGTTISLLYKIKKPIIFIGTGQGYDDFQEFSSEFILNRII